MRLITSTLISCKYGVSTLSTGCSVCMYSHEYTWPTIFARHAFAYQFTIFNRILTPFRTRVRVTHHSSLPSSESSADSSAVGSSFVSFSADSSVKLCLFSKCFASVLSMTSLSEYIWATALV